MEKSHEEIFLIDDFSDPEQASNGQSWHYVSDTVMGGASRGSAQYRQEHGRHALVLMGSVSLENNGGFVQLNLDLAAADSVFDAGVAAGVAVSLCGDGQCYAINLRTADTQRPWQSYRSPIKSSGNWQTHYLPFRSFEAHRLERPLDLSRLRRIGLIAIGNAGPVRVALSRIAFYGDF